MDQGALGRDEVDEAVRKVERQVEYWCQGCANIILWVVGTRTMSRWLQDTSVVVFAQVPLLQMEEVCRNGATVPAFRARVDIHHNASLMLPYLLSALRSRDTLQNLIWRTYIR